MVTHSTNRYAPVAWRILSGAVVALCTCLALPLEAQVANAESLADEIALTELTPGTVAKPTPAARPANGTRTPREAPADKSVAGPVRVSALDIGAKLALLVLVVYGIAWGVKLGQRGGWRLARAAVPTSDGRLRHCGNLALRGGASLHVIEVDGAPVLIATQSSGEVSLLLELRRETMPGAEPVTLTPPARQESPLADPIDMHAVSALRLDSEWEQRRDSLIRALQGAHEMRVPS